MSEQLPKGRPVRSVAVIAMSQAVKVGSAIVSAAILARFLTPDDFGLIATVAPFMILAMMLQDMGFTQAVIQRQEITRSQVSTLFWLNVLVAAVLAITLVASSPFIAAFFGDSRLAAITWGSAAFLIIWALTAQPLALLNRDLRFSAIAWVDITNSVTMLIVGIVVAALTHSYWAILISQIVGATAGLALAIHLAKWRPSLPRIDDGVKEMVHFGAGLSVFSILDYISRTADTFLIARFLGPTQLGLYDRAYKLMVMPLLQVNAPLARVLLPLLGRLRNEPDAYRATYISTVSYLMMALHPALIGVIVFSGPFVRILLGPTWMEVAPIFALLGLASVHKILTNTLGWFFVTQMRTRAMVLTGAYTCATTVASFIVGLRYGAVGVAAAFVVSDFVIRLPVVWWVATRTGPVRLTHLLGAVGPHVAAALMTGLALWLSSQIDPATAPIIFTANVAGAYVIYLGILFLFPSKKALILQAAGRAHAFAQRKWAARLMSGRTS